MIFSNIRLVLCLVVFSVIVVEVLFFNFNLNNQIQNVRPEVVRKLFNENGVGMFPSKNSKQYCVSTLSQGGRRLPRV
jgi:hypothetical protein